MANVGWIQNSRRICNPEPRLCVLEVGHHYNNNKFTTITKKLNLFDPPRVSLKPIFSISRNSLELERIRNYSRSVVKPNPKKTSKQRLKELCHSNQLSVPTAHLVFLKEVWVVFDIRKFVYFWHGQHINTYLVGLRLIFCHCLMSQSV